MSNVVVSLAEFYEEFPEFKTAEYSNICLRAFRQSKLFISTHNCGRLTDEQRKAAIYLMTAHLSLLYQRNMTAAASGNATGGAGGLVASASVGEVSVGYQQIPTGNDMFDYWLATTPYGQQLLALLSMLSSVPFYFGGSLERVF